MSIDRNERTLSDDPRLAELLQRVPDSVVEYIGKEAALSIEAWIDLAQTASDLTVELNSPIPMEGESKPLLEPEARAATFEIRRLNQQAANNPSAEILSVKARDLVKVIAPASHAATNQIWEAARQHVAAYEGVSQFIGSLGSGSADDKPSADVLIQAKADLTDSVRLIPSMAYFRDLESILLAQATARSIDAVSVGGRKNPVLAKAHKKVLKMVRGKIKPGTEEYAILAELEDKMANLGNDDPEVQATYEPEATTRAALITVSEGLVGLRTKTSTIYDKTRQASRIITQKSVIETYTFLYLLNREKQRRMIISEIEGSADIPSELVEIEQYIARTAVQLRESVRITVGNGSEEMQAELLSLMDTPLSKKAQEAAQVDTQTAVTTEPAEAETIQPDDIFQTACETAAHIIKGGGKLKTKAFNATEVADKLRQVRLPRMGEDERLETSQYGIILGIISGSSRSLAEVIGRMANTKSHSDDKQIKWLAENRKHRHLVISGYGPQALALDVKTLRKYFDDAATDRIRITGTLPGNNVTEMIELIYAELNWLEAFAAELMPEEAPKNRSGRSASLGILAAATGL